MIKLSNILKEVMKEDDKEVLSGSTIYDDVIKKELKVEEIPSVKGKYKLGVSGKINPADLQIFKQLYKVSPPRKNKEIGSAGSQGSGNGEIALYWLLKGSGYNDIIDSRENNQPDLKIGNVGIEVKSVDTKTFQLGRFASVQPIKGLLNSLFSISELLQDVEHSEKENVVAEIKSKTVDSSNFSIEDIKNACKLCIDFFNQIKKHKDLTVFPIVKNAYNKIRILFDQIPKDIDKHTPETLAAGLLKLLLIGLLNNKPGIGGYFINIKEDGELEWYKVTEENISKISNEKILTKAAINIKQSSVSIKPELFFGKS